MLEERIYSPFTPNVQATLSAELVAKLKSIANTKYFGSVTASNSQSLTLMLIQHDVPYAAFVRELNPEHAYVVADSLNSVEADFEKIRDRIKKQRFFKFCPDNPILQNGAGLKKAFTQFKMTSGHFSYILENKNPGEE